MTISSLISRFAQTIAASQHRAQWIGGRPALACTLAVLIVFGGALHACTPVGPFTDVFPSDPYYNAIELMRSRCVSNGLNGSFSPLNTLLREEMAAFVIRSIAYNQFGDSEYFVENNQYTQNPYFTDVPSSNGFFPYIQKLKDLGITSGCTATTFCPTDTLPAYQAAVFAVRARQYSDTGAINNSIACPNDFSCTSYFLDEPSSDFWFRWIQKARELVGPILAVNPSCTQGSFCSGLTGTPPPVITRGWMAFYISRGIMRQGENVLTYHNDNSRTGQNVGEITLTTSNVSSATFPPPPPSPGMPGVTLPITLPTDGFVHAQPLYMSGLKDVIAQQSDGVRRVHNVLFVATENNSVYAFDADSGAKLWQTSVLPSGGTAAPPDSDCSITGPQY